MIKQSTAARTMAAPKWGTEQTKTELNGTGNGEPGEVTCLNGGPDEHEEHAEFGDAEAFAAAQAEWDAVETVVPGQEGRPTQIKTEGSLQDSLSNQCLLISFNEALQYFQTTDLTHLKVKIKPTIQRRGFSAFKHCLFGPPRLHQDLLEERDLTFCMAACPFSNEEDIHSRVLLSIYKKLTGSKFDCQRYGNHWETIGFQGVDPATDLRGSGFLGLMNLLYLVMDPRTLPLARDIYKLSTHETQNFPFCVMGINVTRITLQALREECLNKECNRRKQVIAVVNDFYVGTYLQLYQTWKHGNKTIIDSGQVIRDLEIHAKKNAREIIKNLESYLGQKKKQSNVKPDIDDGMLAFVDIGDIDTDNQGS